MKPSTPALLASLALLVTSASAQDSFQSGFGAQTVSMPNGSSSRTLVNGDIVTVDGFGVDLWQADGTFVQNLGIFLSGAFDGVFDIDPTGTFAIVGRTDSSTTPNPVFKVMLDGSGMTQLADVVFNYDGAFAPDGTYYMSAATGGFGAGNSIMRLDTTTGAVTELAQVAGPSGPLSCDALGNLYYATVADGFPAPPASTSILIFLAADLAAADCAGGDCLSEASAITWATGFDGASGMEIDQRTGIAYLLENNFGTGANRIWSVQGGANTGTPLVEGQAFNWMSGLQVMSGSGLPELRAYQPANDARLLYATTDWVSPPVRRELQAARPQLSLSGPGLTGSGQVDLALAGADPGGLALLAYGPTALVAPTETPLALAGVTPLIFSALDLGTTQFFGGPLAVDGSGDAGLSFNNPGGLEGLVTIQAVVIDGLSLGLLGTSTAAPF